VDRERPDPTRAGGRHIVHTVPDETPRPHMELTVIGAGPAFTDKPGATGASYLIRTLSTALLLDFGQGSFPRLELP
jgi:hypothetical protein